VQLRPHTIAYRRPGSSRDGKINRQEGPGTASSSPRRIEQPEYKKTTPASRLASVWSLWSATNRPSRLTIFSGGHLSPDRYELHRFCAVTPRNSKATNATYLHLFGRYRAARPAILRDQELFKAALQRRASRAREPNVDVHSLSPTTTSADDLRRKLIDTPKIPAAHARAR